MVYLSPLFLSDGRHVGQVQIFLAAIVVDFIHHRVVLPRLRLAGGLVVLLRNALNDQNRKTAAVQKHLGGDPGEAPGEGDRATGGERVGKTA